MSDTHDPTAPTADEYVTAAAVAMFHARSVETRTEAAALFAFAAQCYHRAATEERAAREYAAAANAEYAAYEAAARAVRMSSATGGGAA